ncbi:MAG TPA: nicotinate-nucleotide adenylyltransferase [Thermoleophilaceae bacterium]|nr:nicotinate-nucleotide adenylyltransferase [Thermoleophilaceae bacterium]
MRVGILGGVFNPPHIGHLVCAQEAHEQLRLDRVLLVPVGEAPHRSVEGDPGAEARAELCERAVAGDERFRVSRIEVERPGPSYTLDTLRELSERSPQDSLVLILGADQVAGLPEWRGPEEVLRLAVVAVAEREGARREEVRRATAGLRGAERIGFFAMPRIDVSSTLVRERAAAGRPVRYLVPHPVAEVIEQRGLYRSEQAVGAE